MNRFIKVVVLSAALIGGKLYAEEDQIAEAEELSTEHLEKVLAKIDELSKKLEAQVEEYESLSEEVE